MSTISETLRRILRCVPSADTRQKVTKKERASFYSAKILEESPSESVDREILRVCANSKKKYTSAYLPLFLKKHAAAPVCLIMIMVALGGYVTYHSMNAKSMSAKMISETSMPVASASERDNISAAALSETDSSALFDSLGDSGSAFSKTRGNLNMEGVVTVKSSE